MTTNYSYDSFGGTTASSNSFSNEVQFTGAISDKTGVYYMNSRYYNPKSGRFLTQDTYSGNAYEPWTQHLYTYCGNNPVSMVDPTGHYTQQVPGGYIETTTGQFYPCNITVPDPMDIVVDNVPSSFKTVLADLNDPELERKACMDLIDNNGCFSPSMAAVLPPLVVDFAELSYRNRTPVEMIDVAYWKKIQDEREACMLGVTTVAAIEANVSSSLSGGVGKCTGADYYASGSTSYRSSGSGTTRVGRWMSKGEYNAMNNTGKVQMSPNGNTTYVANPANPNAYTGATAGSVYVEFDVPTNSIYPAGKDSWGQIAGPGSLWDRVNQYKGLPPITSMPNATNIRILGE